MGQAAIRAIDLPAHTVQEHLIWDEYILRACEMGKLGPTLRFWKVQEPAVVLGYSGKLHNEVREKACQRLGIPVVRRTSGGGTVLLDGGCLNYSLVLPLLWHPSLASVSQTNQFIMKRHQAAIAALTGEAVDLEGDTDLAIGGRKISGNAQRRMKSSILFHGTFLSEINHDLMEQLLPSPERQPKYRNGRKHIHFLRNLSIREIILRRTIQDCWHCPGDQPLDIVVEQPLMKEAKERFMREPSFVSSE